MTYHVLLYCFFPVSEIVVCLQFDGAPSAEDQGLPDTLDIGDTSESRVVDSASLKLKKSADEAGASGPSAPFNIS